MRRLSFLMNSDFNRSSPRLWLKYQFAEGHAFTRAIKSRAGRRYRSAEGWSESPKGEATDFIAVVLAVIFRLPFSAQNRLSSPKPPCIDNYA